MSDLAIQHDLQMDAMLGVRTTGRDESHANLDNNPYEPTPYAVLERLANSGYICKRNTVVDYGCGKGRVGFYLYYQLRCRVIGIECDEWLYEGALRNRKTAASAAKVEFELSDATEYVLPAGTDRFYFFNPFSVGVFEKVLTNIRASLDEHPREALLLVYYPDATYIDLLDGTGWLRRAEAIDCRDLFATDDPREAIMVWRNQE